MRIVDFRTYIAPPPRGSWLNEVRGSTPMSVYPEYAGKRGTWRGPNAQDVIVKVISDEGVTGLGVTRGGAVVQSIIDAHLKSLLIGRDPRNVERLWDQMYQATLAYGRKGAAIMALSALDLALWDLVGKWMNQPLYRLFGGAVRDELPCYATHPDSHALVREGFVGTKIPMAYGPADGRDGLRKNVERIEKVRAAVGPDVDVMLDCWMSWNVEYTIQFARAAADLRVRWIEEPLPPDDLDGHVELRRRLTDIQVATGEHEYTRFGFRELLRRGCADVLQPDVAWCGGITEIRRVAAMASAHGIPVIPHNGVLQPWAMHLMFATPNSPMAEYLVFYGPEDQAPPPIVQGELVPQGGRVRPSDLPGAGVAFDLDEWQRQTAAAADRAS
jgi:L-rhamnonate dehydratase